MAEDDVHQQRRDGEVAHEAKAKDEQFSDPCPDLNSTLEKLEKLNATVSESRLFNLYWKDDDFTVNSFVTDVENELNNAAIVAERGELFTNKLIELSKSVNKAAEELSVTVKEKLASEFEIVQPGECF